MRKPKLSIRGEGVSIIIRKKNTTRSTQLRYGGVYLKLMNCERVVFEEETVDR